MLKFTAMKLNVFYRRPSFVSHPPTSSNGDTDYLSEGKAGTGHPPSIVGIPDELSLDKIIDGRIRSVRINVDN